MSSDRQVAANRANAARSTGPRTATGRARSSRNATRHGLSTPAAAMPEFVPEVARLATAIAGDAASDPNVLEAATRIPAPSIEVARIRRLRAEIIERILREPELAPLPARDDSSLPRFPALNRFTKAAYILAYQEGRFSELIAENKDYFLQEILFKGHAEAAKAEAAATLTRARETHRQRAADWQQLETLERYERRALSRRAAAVAALDDTITARSG